MEQLRASVRTVVEFTLHGADIRPAHGALKDMQEGTLGHRARQGLLGEGWEAEVALQLTTPVEEDCELLLTGRMDAFCDGDVPIIEEIKLWQRREPPDSPLPAHEMQAVGYGHMLCETRGVKEVVIRVVYVDRRGKVRGRFDMPMAAVECRERFLTVLEPYVRRLRMLRQHRRARDASLQALTFPFGSYRPGQREMAVQVFTAVRLQRRLFASMPTGTGKSVAALFPALKALGAGLTGQVYYLTARTTQRQGALEAVRRMRGQPLHLWTLVIDAKDKQCPAKTLCHPDYCPRAKGHFLRDHAAMEEMLQSDDWSPEAIRTMAEKHCLCPFEFSLSLAEIADLTVCDYNYTLDPAVHIQRIFDHGADVTLLIDEAHNLLPRVRDMLSGWVDGGRIRRLRTVVGKNAGHKHALYKAMTEVLKALDDLPVPEDAQEGALTEIPRSLDEACMELADAFLDAQGENISWDGEGESVRDVLLPLLSFVRARKRDTTEYAWLWQGRKNKTVHAFALDVADYFAETTQRLRGVVCFSATMHPLEDMKRLLGGTEEDACFAMPSPFPRENLLILNKDVNTRYQYRGAACGEIADAIRAMTSAKPGRYITFFPSFAYLRQVSALLDEQGLPHQVQTSGMTDGERAEFLAPYVAGGEAVLSLCVLGGVFAEGIDLPGDALDGVAIVGVGLPQVNLFQQTLREYYDRTMDAGFLYAYMLPGMQKVAQAVGRVIRTETDRGVALLLDDRYRQGAYRRLCPEHWEIELNSECGIRNAESRMRAFWASEDDRAT
ncbi:MAG: hypothetical protein IKK57_03470 [Clostridia bacterium]|nr:hypothetical protein [Clostridia bacterium]